MQAHNKHRDRQEHTLHSPPHPQVLDSPPNLSQDQPLGGFFEGASNVEISGGNFYNIHSASTDFSPASRREEHEIHQNLLLPSPLSTPSSRIPDHNPEPLHAPNSSHNQFLPQSMHKQGPSSSISTAVYSANEIYERHLGLRQRGFPLWIPEPNQSLPMPYRRQGVSIGDVGIITPSGGFSFLFNICLPHDDPINPPMLPEGFASIYPPIDPRDIHVQSELKPTSYMASTSIERIDNDPPFRGLSFAISSTEGALLTLPDGIVSRDLENIEQFREYADANVESWYRYVNGPRGRGAKNGEVRLVVGCDKATSWGMAAVANMNQRKAHHLKYRSVGGHEGTTTPIPLYEWDYTGMWEARVGPDLSEVEDLMRGDDSNVAKGGKYWNQCLFVRTLNITLSDAAFAEISRELKSASPQSRNWGGSNAVTSHPADALNKRILQEFPDSRVVITQDEDWCSVVSKDDEIMPSPSEIAEHVLAAHNITEEDGVTFLEPRDRQSSLRHSQVSSRHSIIADHIDSQSLIAGSSLMSSSSISLAPTEWYSFQSSTPTIRSFSTLLNESNLLIDIDANDIVVAVMGTTGTGKSSFINTLIGSEVMPVSGGLHLCTQEVRAVGRLCPGRSDQKIIMVDTPGFDNCSMSDYDILKKIAEWLESTYSKHIKLSGILYFHNINSGMQGTARKNLDMFQRLCGPEALKNVILLTTFWDMLDSESIGLAREKQLREVFWRALIDQGSRTERFDPPTYERAWDIIGQFPPATNIPLAIQVELVDEHKKLSETAAFKFL